MADDLMRQNLVATLTHGWAFNVEFSWRIGVNSCCEFIAPASMLAFQLTPRADQYGGWAEEATSGGYPTAPNGLDLTLRPLANLAASDSSVDERFKFYDRTLGMSSFGSTAGTTEVSSDSSGTPAVSSDNGSRDQIFIDPIWSMDFEDTPVELRSFVTMLTARQFCQRVAGDADQAGFTEKDLGAAWVELEEEYGVEEELNIMDNMDVARILGGRPRGGVMGDRSLRYV
jgi:hypothetical protein